MEKLKTNDIRRLDERSKNCNLWFRSPYVWGPGARPLCTALNPALQIEACARRHRRRLL